MSVPSVLITPASGEIRFKPSGSSETMSIFGDNLDEIRFEGDTTGPLVSILDSASDTLVPSANDYGLGSDSQRWRLRATRANLSPGSGAPAIEFASSGAVVSPAAGDMWYDGTNLYFRNSSTTFILTSGITGSGDSGQVTFWSGTSTLSSAATFTFDSGSGQLTLSTTGSGAGIVIGGDTQLYRSAADVITTPDSLVVGANLTVNSLTSTRVPFASTSGLLVDSANLTYTTGTGQLALATTGSGAGLLLGGDAQLYRSAADVLRTPDSLTVDGVLTLGAAGGTTGTLNLLGSTSGTISILAQAAAGTYNFNLPTTAGSSGYLLTSAGGGSSPMTWTEAGAVAVRWSSLQNPSGNLSLSMSTHTSTLTWATGTSTSDLLTLATAASANGTGALLNIQTGASSTVLPLRVRAGSVESIYVNSSGAVGIGTTGPDRKLDVLDASNPQIRLTQADGTAYVDLQGSSSGDLAVTGSRGFLGVGGTPSARLHLQGNASTAAWTTNGAALRIAAATYTDTSSSGTVAAVAASALAQPTLAASSSVTYTAAATLYIANAPANGTNVTITNPLALWVDAGVSRFDGRVSCNDDLHVVGQTDFYPSGSGTGGEAALTLHRYSISDSVRIFFKQEGGAWYWAMGMSAASGNNYVFRDEVSGSDRFIIETNGAGPQLTLQDDDTIVIAASNTLYFGSDTNLYRSAADVLSTDDSLHALGSVRLLQTSAAGAGLHIYDDSSTNYVKIVAPVAEDLSASYTLTLPQTDGSSGQYLKTDGSGVLSWDSPSGGGGMSWSEVTGTSATMSVNTGYIANNAGLVTLTLPASAAVGDVIEIVGKGAGGWRIAQGSGQQVHYGSVSNTSGGSGQVNSTHRRDTVRIVCVTANNEWQVVSGIGNVDLV